MVDTPMPLTAHLAELRSRLIWCMVALAGGFIVCYGLSDRIVAALQAPVVLVGPPVRVPLQIIAPAETHADALFDEFHAFGAERQELRTPVFRVLGTLQQPRLDELVGDLAGGRAGGIEALADIRDAARAVVVELHQDAVLRHGQPSVPGELLPASHGALHEEVHEGAYSG